LLLDFELLLVLLAPHLQLLLLTGELLLLQVQLLLSARQTLLLHPALLRLHLCVSPVLQFAFLLGLPLLFLFPPRVFALPCLLLLVPELLCAPLGFLYVERSLRQRFAGPKHTQYGDEWNDQKSCTHGNCPKDT
jgi:hypothetical protein